MAAQAKEDTPPVNGAMKQHIDDDAPANGAAKPRKRVTFVLPSRSAGSSRCVVIPTAALRAPEEDAAAEKHNRADYTALTTWGGVPQRGRGHVPADSAGQY